MKTLGHTAVALAFAVSLCALLGVALATPLRAETVADFYRGRTLKFVSGFSPSGEYDFADARSGTAYGSPHSRATADRCIEHARSRLDDSG